MFVTDGKTTIEVPRSNFFREEMREDEIITVPLKVHEYYLRPVSELSDEELKNFILFWHFLGNSQRLAEGIREYVYTRKIEDSLSPSLDEYLVPVREYRYYARKGYDELSKLISMGTTEEMNIAIREGNLPFLKYLRDYTKRSRYYVSLFLDAKMAMKNNYLDILEYIHEEVRPIDMRDFFKTDGPFTDTINTLPIFSFLYERKVHYTPPAYFLRNTRMTREILSYLESHDSSYLLNSIIFDKAAHDGDIEPFLYFQEKGYEIEEYSYKLAFKKGSADFFQKVHDSGLPLTSKSVSFAAHYGALEVLKLFHTLGLPLTSSTVQKVVERHYFDCFYFLHDIGVGYEHLATLAVNTCNLSLLKFAHAHGYKITERTIGRAKYLNVPQIVSFLQEIDFSLDK